MIIIDENKFFKLIILIMVIIIPVVGLAVSGKLYLDSQKQLQELKNQTLLEGTPTPLNDRVTVEKVARHMVLPNEMPKVISVIGSDQLKAEQPFFDKAKDGDKLLIYTQKIILYDPVADRIMEIAQIRPDTSPTASSVN